MVPNPVPERRSTVILDGRRLALERSADLSRRATAVTERRGRAPRLCLVAFAAPGATPPYVERKIEACAATGVDTLPLILPAGSTTAEGCTAITQVVEGERPDAVFVEFPFPPHVDGEALVGVVPERLDIDVMTEGRTRRYLSEGEGPPPLTVSAGLALLDRFGVDVTALEGVVVGEVFPFTSMFREALVRRGVRMPSVVTPDVPDLPAVIAGAELVVAAASRPGLLRSEDLAPGAVAIDAGYFNPGGKGDIDTSGGTAHLSVLAPVPGGIGPMTVSMLVERVIEFAETSGSSA